jgi:hypothetical protein
VSYDLSRLSRSTKETLELVEHAHWHGTRIHVGDLGVLDPENPTATFTMTTMAAINKMYRDNISKRSRETALARKAQGLPVGRPPYGGLPGEDPNVVLAAFKAAGSFNKAATVLNAQGFPTRSGSGQWTAKQVFRVVRRIEPTSKPQQPRVRAIGTHILTGLCRCHCGRPMQAWTTSDGPRVVCGFGLSDPTHTGRKYRAVSKVLPWVKAEAARLQAPESVIEEVAGDETLRAGLTAKRERIVDSFMDGTITKADRDRRLAEVDDQLAGLAIRIEVVTLPTIDWENWSPDAINGVLRAMWDHIEMDEQLDPVRAEWRVPEWRAE